MRQGKNVFLCFCLAAAQGRKMRVWERRLLRDFHVVSVTAAGDEEETGQGISNGSNDPESSNQKGRRDNSFRRVANSVTVAINPVPPTITSHSGRIIKSL